MIANNQQQKSLPKQASFSDPDVEAAIQASLKSEPLSLD